MLPIYNVYIAPFLLMAMTVAEILFKHGHGIIENIKVSVTSDDLVRDVDLSAINQKFPVNLQPKLE